MRTTPRYERPADLASAVGTLAASPGAAVLAGGTDLMNDLRLGLARPPLVVDTAGLRELRSFSVGEEAVLGAATTMASLLRSPAVRERVPALAEAAELLGGRQMQTVATVGGNLCHASPAAETATPLLVYDTVAVVAGPSGRREVPLTSFWQGPRATCLAPGELLVELRVPATATGASAYRRLELRRSVDIAVVSASARLTHEEGAVTGARVALGAVAPVPLRVPEAEAALTGVPLGDPAAVQAAVAMAAARCRAASRPIDDTRASARYRAAMVEVITTRCLEAVVDAVGVTRPTTG